MPAQGLPHALCVTKATRALLSRFAEPYLILIQSTVAFSDWSGPEPDIAVFSGSPAQGAVAPPMPPLLIVEVSQTTLHYDRVTKGSFYASHGLQDYWVANLIDRIVEVYRDPHPDPAARFGWSHGAPLRVPPTGKLSPLMLPSQEILVTDILP
jgi:Uma2 family endonuclease